MWRVRASLYDKFLNGRKVMFCKQQQKRFFGFLTLLLVATAQIWAGVSDLGSPVPRVRQDTTNDMTLLKTLEIYYPQISLLVIALLLVLLSLIIIISCTKYKKAELLIQQQNQQITQLQMELTIAKSNTVKTLLCASCGLQIKDGASFCGNCGAKVGVPASVLHAAPSINCSSAS